MATLTQTAYFARKAIKYGGIAFAVLIFLRASYITIKKLIPEKPKPLPPANIAFGKLPKMQFPPQNLSKINYRMETISGSLPRLPSQTRVYFMPLQSAGFLTQEKIITWAKNLGFGSNPQPAGNDDLNFRFSLQNSPGTTLDVHILTKNFYFNFDWKNNPAILGAQPLIDENQSTSKARSFFSAAGSFPPEIDPAFTKTVFLKNDNGSLVESLPQEANFHKINFFRQTSDGVRIYPPDPKSSNISAVVSSAENGFSGVIQAKFINVWEIDNDNAVEKAVKEQPDCEEEIRIIMKKILLIMSFGVCIDPSQIRFNEGQQSWLWIPNCWKQANLYGCLSMHHWILTNKIEENADIVNEYGRI